MRGAAVRRTGFVPAAAPVLHWPWLHPARGASAVGLTGNIPALAHHQAQSHDLGGPAAHDARKAAVVGGSVAQRR